MRSSILSAWTLAAFLITAITSPAMAAEFDVPAVFPTIQAAVAAAAVSPDEDNYINLTESPVFTSAEVSLGDAFSCTHRLTIRPASGFDRATIASLNGFEPIFRLNDVACVTFQDLDIVRNTTNANHLIMMTYEASGNSNILFERCRIGSIWTAPGTSGWSYMYIFTPYSVVVRNCIFFSNVPADFDKGIIAQGFDEPANSLLLYNNVVADYRLRGIEIPFATAGVILLRNNVAVNHPDAPPGSEPYAYASGIDEAGPIIVTSHNTAFASVDHKEELAVGARSIAGTETGEDFLRFDRADVDDAFISRTWILIPPWDPNEDFYDLDPDGVLHEVNAWGLSVPADGSPDVNDIALLDDIDGDPRPSGFPEHTDRGADQVDPLIVGVRGLQDDRLWAVSVSNPSIKVGLIYRTSVAGRLVFEVFDVVGRRLYFDERTVTAGDVDQLEWSGPRVSGLFLYRLKLTPGNGPPVELQGKITILR